MSVDDRIIGEDALPPPAFPPGARKHRTVLRPEAAGEVEGESDGARIPPEALISPEDTERARSGEEADTEAEADTAGAGVQDPAIVEAAEALQRVSGELRRRGPEALAVGPDTGEFEAVLKGFLAGYLGEPDDEAAEDPGEDPVS